MAQELTTFADRPALSPKHSKFFEENKNIQDRQTVPSISYEGKKWTIVLNGEKRIVQKKDADGDLVPVTTLKVVVLDQNPVRGRAYYEGAYNPSSYPRISTNAVNWPRRSARARDGSRSRARSPSASTPIPRCCPGCRRSRPRDTTACLTGSFSGRSASA